MATVNASTSCAERNYAASCGKFYTYIHTTSDLAGEPSRVFYVGKGQKNRAWGVAHRNKYWTSIVGKHGLNVTICAYWDSEEDAHEHEKFLILCFRDMGVRLANMTDGGEGMSGYVKTQETRAKHSKAIRQYLSLPENRMKSLRNLESIRANPEIQERRSSSLKNSWSDPAAKVIRVAAMYTPDNKARHLSIVRDPEVRARHLAGVRAINDDREFVERRSASMRKVLCKDIICKETGMVFETLVLAVEWLKTNGHPKARRNGIQQAMGRDGRSAYKYHWGYA